MPAATKHLLIEKGATFRFSAIWKNKQTGQPIDLTGYTARMHIRATTDAATTITTMTTENARIVLGGTAGTISLYISDTDTAALTAGDAVYDLELVAPGGDVTRLLKGKVKIDADVTR